MVFYVYILECADGSFYVGSHRGDDLAVRVGQHNAGVHPHAWTFTRRPVRLVYSETYPEPDPMILRERQLKGWSRAKKIALISEQNETLPSLSRSRDGKRAHPSTGSG